MLAFNGRLVSRRLGRKLSTKLQYSNDVSAAQSIKIPPRIERSPTDILKAISSTIGRDTTAAHYKYHDDPYFIPMSNTGKRTFALAQEAGRNAAIWVRQQHPDLFQHRVADPIISDFLPRAVYNEDSKVTEEMLLDEIKQAHVSESVAVYHLLEKHGVSIKSKQALLELLCFCNHQEPLAAELTEQRWFARQSRVLKKGWKSNDLADQLFASLKNEDDATAAAAYNAMICGTAKYVQTELSWSLYLECQAKRLPIYTTTFNNILKICPYLKDNSEQLVELMREVLSTMSQQNVKPDIGTLNSCLHIASLLRAPNPGRGIALSVYKEMTSLGVTPSLATYWYLLVVFCRKNGPHSQILIDILNKLEGKEMEIKDPNDLFFFVKAMDIARNYMNDGAIANRVHKLLLTGKNYNMIGENHMESIYYRHYLTILVQTQPLDKFMSLYDSLVPNIYIPEPDVMNEILQMVEVTGIQAAEELLPRLWSQMIMFDHVQRESLLIRVLQIMYTNCNPSADSPVHQQYGDIAWDIWTRIQNQRTQVAQRINWTGEMIGQVAVLCIRAGYLDKFFTVVSFLTEKGDNIVGILGKNELDTIFNGCIENGNEVAAVKLVEYATNNGFMDAGQMAYRAVHTLSLSSLQQEKLISLVGKDILQLNLG